MIGTLCEYSTDGFRGLFGFGLVAKGLGALFRIGLDFEC